MSKKTKGLHLVLKDLETSETIVDATIDAIIGAYHVENEPDYYVSNLVATRCNAVALASTFKAVEDTIENEADEDVKILLSLLRAEQVKEKEEHDND